MDNKLRVVTGKGLADVEYETPEPPDPKMHYQMKLDNREWFGHIELTKGDVPCIEAFKQAKELLEEDGVFPEAVVVASFEEPLFRAFDLEVFIDECV